MLKPHSAFEYIRADEVAECWEGVSRMLYCTLWGIVARQRPIPNLEDSGPHDHVGFESLASHWDELSEETQAELNKLAEAMEPERSTFESLGEITNRIVAKLKDGR